MPIRKKDSEIPPTPRKSKKGKKEKKAPKPKKEKKKKGAVVDPNIARREK